MKGPERTVGYRLEDKDQGDEHHIFHWSDAYRTVHDLFINDFVLYNNTILDTSGKVKYQCKIEEQGLFVGINSDYKLYYHLSE